MPRELVFSNFAIATRIAAFGKDTTAAVGSLPYSTWLGRAISHRRPGKGLSIYEA